MPRSFYKTVSAIKRTGVFLVYVLLMSTSANAGELVDKCPVSRPETFLKSRIVGAEVTKTKSAVDMTEWQLGHSMAPNGGQILGLGGGEIETSYNAEFEVSPFQTGYCVVLHEIRAKFIAKPQIHVASNFEEGSCEYSEVLFHEQKHIEALRLFHRRHTKDLRAKLREVSRSMPSVKPVPQKEVSSVQKKLLHYVQVEMNSYFQEILKELQQTQQKIDSPEEYERVAKKCRKWEQKLSKQPD
jgi:hypothetical protein